MTRVDRIFALVILVFGGLACMESIRMGLWKGEVPGSGFFPLVGAGGMTLLAVLLLITSRGASPGERKTFVFASNELKQLSGFVPALLLYPIFVHFLGFAPASCSVPCTALSAVRSLWLDHQSGGIVCWSSVCCM